jgi:GTP-binding protein Era
VSIGAGERALSELVLDQGHPVFIAANKVDRIAKQTLLERMVDLSNLIGERPYEAIVPLSASNGDGCDTLLRLLSERMPEGPPYFPEDETTDQRAEELIAEYVREASLALLRDELPHASGVEIDEMDEREDGLLNIECTIWVEAESQVGIVVGKSGATVKEIGSRARATIEREFERNCFLRIRVKARHKWRDDESHLARMGL